jgi:hypothetical protein
MSERLTVTTAKAPYSLGPLTVEVIGPTGDSTEFTLTSSHREHQMEVDPGRYAVVARRPNGDRLRRHVSVAPGSPATVHLAEGLGPSPHEFMEPELMRGDIGPSVPVEGRSALRPKFFGGAVLPQHPQEHRLTVRIWPEGRAPSRTIAHYLGGTCLKLRIPPGPWLAVGLMDEDGFGPIVFVPPLRAPVNVTFLSEAVAAKAAARFLDPSGRRTSVALATPEEAAAADLLAAIGSPIVEDAEAIWQQSAASLDAAADFVLGKFSHPGEALLGAHYLLRFLPDRLPLAWADNLSVALPEAVDGPVIAAWLRLLSRADEVRKLGPEGAAREMLVWLAEACRRKIALYARARFLLVKGLNLYSEAELAKMKIGGDLKQPGPASFLSYGADAGGFEAFWGTGPFSPGHQKASGPLGSDFLRLRLGGPEAAFGFRYESSQQA